MSVPGHMVFIFAADYLKHGHSTINIYFALSYLLVACMQVRIYCFLKQFVFLLKIKLS